MFSTARILFWGKHLVFHFRPKSTTTRSTNSQIHCSKTAKYQALSFTYQRYGTESGKNPKATGDAYERAERGKDFCDYESKEPSEEDGDAANGGTSTQWNQLGNENPRQRTIAEGVRGHVTHGGNKGDIG